MTEDYGEFDTPSLDDNASVDEKKNKTLWIILIVVFVIFCLCCGCLAAIYFGIEPLMNILGIPIPWQY